MDKKSFETLKSVCSFLADLKRIAKLLDTDYEEYFRKYAKSKQTEIV